MEVENLIESFSEFKDVKNIDRETMMNILEDVFKAVLAKKYDDQGKFDVIINVDKGDLEIWKNREVVEDSQIENPISQISLSEALKIEDDYEVGEEVSEQVSFESEFGRRQVLSIRQHLMARIADQHRDELMKRYEDRIGEIIHGEVYQIWRNEILLQDDEGNDLSLPKEEQIPKDFFKKGESVRAVIKEVNLKNNKANIVLSRIAPEFIMRLFEQEVPLTKAGTWHDFWLALACDVKGIQVFSHFYRNTTSTLKESWNTLNKSIQLFKVNKLDKVMIFGNEIILKHEILNGPKLAPTLNIQEETYSLPSLKILTKQYQDS